MRRALLLFLGAVATACSLVTNFDAFTSGGPPPTPDGGNDATTTTDAAHEMLEAGGEAGATLDPYGAAVLADQPTSWWRFEDAPGATTLKDEMGNHDAGVFALSEGQDVSIQFGINGAVGKAAKVGNKGGFFKVGDFFDFTGQAEFTLEAWAQNDSPQSEYENIFNKRLDNETTPVTGWLIYLHKQSRSLGFQFWKDTDVSGGISTTLGTGFHHIVLTSTRHPSGISFVMYLDGVETDADNDVTPDEEDTDVSLILGYAWSGSLDEIAIYEHSLSADRVQAHFHAAKQ